MIALEQLQTYANKVAAFDHSGHASDHIQRVVANVKRLLAKMPAADPTIALAAAMLHDTYDDKLVADVAAARRQTQAQLAKAGATAIQQTAVLTIIDHMGFKANLAGHQKLSLEGELVQDADRLDALGAIGIARAFMYGGAHGSKMYDPELPPRQSLDATSYRQGESTVLNHFEEKLFKLVGQMNTPAGKIVAEQRTAVMRRFVAEFLLEFQGKA